MSSCRSSTSRILRLAVCFFTVAVLNYICIISNYIPNLRNGVELHPRDASEYLRHHASVGVFLPLV